MAHTTRARVVRQLRQKIASLNLKLQQRDLLIRRLSRENAALLKRSPMKKVPLDRLNSESQKRLRLQRVRRSLGDSMLIIEKGQHELSVESTAALRSTLNLTDKQYIGVRKLAGRSVPPLATVQNWMKSVFNEAELIDYKRVDGIQVVYWRRPDRVFNMYMERLATTSWSQQIPNKIHVVVAGDRGGNPGSKWTKMGLFVPNNVKNSQSPNNFVGVRRRKC